MVQHTTPLWRRLQYRFDYLVSRSTTALIGWLTLACLSVVVPASVVLVRAGHQPPATLSGQLTAVWVSVGQTLKIGGAVGSPLYVLASVLLALIALLFVSTLVSLITAGINQRIMELRLGHSRLLETRHTVVLGWSDQVFPVTAELVAANSNQRRAVVAVLAPKDKVEMEQEIDARVPATGTTTIVCRNGCTTDPAVLTRVSPQTAKAVLVLPPGADDGDTHVVKTLLALNAVAAEPGDAIVVAAVHDAHNRVAAQLAAGPRGHVLAVDDIVARLLVQTARQPGLSLVYQELLNFAGDEFYTVDAPALTGRTFGEALLSFTTSSAVGLLRENGTVTLNPNPATEIAPGDRIVVIAKDDDTTVVAAAASGIDEEAIATAGPRAATAERLLLLGWNRRAPLIVQQLATYVSAGTTLDIVALGDHATMRGAQDVAVASQRLDVTLHSADTTDPRVLARLNVPSYDSVIVIGDAGRTPTAATVATQVAEADDRTLVTLLHLRSIEQASGKRISLTTEMTDDRNRLLAPAREGADFIVSGRLTSLLMAQISENPSLADVFDELFDAEGSELYLKPAADYVHPGSETTFATVVASARRRHECAVGYRLRAQAATGPAYGVRINPDKRQQVRFTAEDWVIVLAES
ncbi:NAD-binding lipoprotein [Streptomyces agglomeratus]|uniref:CASTOR/POLLUX-related putative ion channel n=1 Tax=Streptomyces agglomeratus TaxID=285458 RepID=UPI0008683862|nr:NAD-binding lipoprotein [Streptomyces agglomeratus]OEJ62250.1 NAD-binding lipoprotein [Streptomyces agglomeratus]